MDGVDVIKALRGWTRVPILVLSARQASDEKVAALDAGADDYITKPFSMDELMARLRAAVRRTEGAPVAVREADLDEVVPMALGRVREDSVELDVPETLPMVHGAGGHDKIRTGTEDQKFGLSIRDGYAHAIARILDQPQLELTGLHCHLGSQITQRKAVPRRHAPRGGPDGPPARAALPQLDLGGGHGIAYRPGEEALDLTALARKVRTELTEACGAAGIPVPRLVVEPGRAIAGPAGIALYHVLAVKRTGDHIFVAVDGGMSDNPRPALYGVRYAPRLIGRASAESMAPVTVVGRHCEAGDVLAGDVELPADVRPGDQLAVPVAGAYHLSMASGYNLVGRPPVAAVRAGHARLLVRHESMDDIRSRDVGL
ncbi:response regulator [Streptomyces sp. NPDC005209]|uniref:response regulator n=1 Tax=Streptomyces sp. NPDC005209 TaxID=3156715 RepID=UPI0033A66CFB